MGVKKVSLLQRLDFAAEKDRRALCRAEFARPRCGLQRICQQRGGEAQTHSAAIFSASAKDTDTS